MSAHRDGPISLLDRQGILSKTECQSVWDRAKGFARGGGATSVLIRNWWTDELRWARNRVSLASDRQDTLLMVVRWNDGEGAHANWGSRAATNQLDDESIEGAVRAAERNLSVFGRRFVEDLRIPPPAFEYPKTAIWSDATAGLSAEAQGEIARRAIEPAEAQGMLSAGYLELRRQSGAVVPGAINGVDASLTYSALSQAQCSTTVRDKSGTGSGWAGLSSYDWANIDPAALSERALQKALASRNPVSLEPGRYTVILEPQAVHDLVSTLLVFFDRHASENQLGPFALGFDQALQMGRSKLGLKVADERVTIEHDPADPALGTLPFDWRSQGDGSIPPYRAVKWIDRGVLTSMIDKRERALETRTENLPFLQSGSFRMRGGETSMDEMIKSTKRGLIVTRFSNVRVLDSGSVMCTGFTRDGLWLVENGAITKAVRNFRFTESPLFVLNSLEQLGPAVPVFRPVTDPYDMGVTPAIVPPVKARDFSFTSTIDAI
jgi:predicted Zn-dependent protease